MAIVWIILTQLVLVDLCTGAIVNIALNKPASVSSEYKPPGTNYTAANAVDGNTTAKFPSIMHTDVNQTFAWWMVDLQTQVQDAKVKIYFRTDYPPRRNGVKLYTSTNTIPYPPSGGTPCHTFTDPVPDINSVNCPGSWRYLMVHTTTRTDGIILDFGEVEVFVCSNDTYGQNCTKSCDSRHCAETSPACPRYTGMCQGGCQAGWMGTDCMQACSNGMYGPNCSESCSSRQCNEPSSTCDHFNGTCTEGCQAGWMGTDCMEACESGTYGNECNMTCEDRHCASSSSCNHVTGQCDGECQPGWDGTDCTQKCPVGQYGGSCNRRCESRQCFTSSDTCDHVTGACEGRICKDGYMGTDCSRECSNVTYGQNCDKSCSSRHCAVAPTTCDLQTGSCSIEGCEIGWFGTDCSQPCESGTYGNECNVTCEDRNCESPTSCDHVTGQCDGECQPGWDGTDCTQKCPVGQYGGSCKRHCESRQCLTSSDTCDHVTGACEGRICKDGYMGTDCSQAIVPVTTDSILIPAVVGAVAGVLVIIIIIIVIIVYRRKSQPLSKKDKPKDKKFSEAVNGGSVYVNVGMDLIEDDVGNRDKQKQRSARNSSSKTVADPVEDEQDEEIMDEDEPSPNRDYYNESADVIREIPVADLIATVAKIKQREGGFEAEYHSLATGFTAPYDDSKKPENAGKNKFRGYYPYDHNRVRLSLIPKIPGSDYINASLMHSYDQMKTYIAAQAPNKKTVGDFWRMIWEQRCDRVIMLTGLVEDMKVKCYQYWPKDDILQTDHYRIEVEVTDIRANYTVRHLKVTSKMSGEERTVVQYHYTAWPDHGVPDTLALVNFIWMIRGLEIRSNGPLLVHCSAGIGRTGTYIAVDSLFDQARGEGMVDVQGYVTVMRGQRKNMIQTKEQYECVFNCLVEMTTFGNTSMDVENFTTSYSSRGMDSMVDRKTLRELTQTLVSEEPKDSPGQHRMWGDGNQDFIIRVGPTLRYLRGYLQVVAPAPGMERLLWKLVEENNVLNVIVVSPVEVDVGKKGTTKKYGGIMVTTTDQSTLTSDLSLETLQVRETNTERSRNVKLFRFSSSPTMDSIPSRLLDHAHLHHLSTEMSPVVLIHSEHDRKSTAWFCIKANILSGILEDLRVDVIGHVRTFLKCCPELTITEEEVESLHEFAQKCLQLTETTSTYANL